MTNEVGPTAGKKHQTPHHDHRDGPAPTRPPSSRFRAFVTDDTNSGLLLMAVAAVAIVLANSPLADTYLKVAHTHVGPESLGLNLSIEHWAADGILTVFFFVVGLELKTEFVTGALRDIREAALPMLAAAFGVVGPAIVYVVFQVATGSDALSGWAVPTATDIAFAVAVLGIVGKGLPHAARTFLLTLAVVDDLIAIIIIAFFFSSGLDFLMLGLALVAIAAFALLTRRHITTPWLLIPLGLLAWYFMYRSGVHATIAGVALGLVVPAKMYRGSQMSVDFAWKLAPLSAGVALPIFAFFAAGVPVLGGEGDFMDTLASPIALGIALALPLGKFLGIWGSVAVLTRTTRLRMGDELELADIRAIAVLGGVGFTVAMLVAGLSFPDEATIFVARFGVLLGTVVSAIVGGLLTHHRATVHNRRAGLI